MPRLLNNINELNPIQDVLVYTHLGLGDILANFAINKTVLNRTSGKVYLPVKSRYLESMMHLYNDENRVIVFEVNIENYAAEQQDVYNIINNFNLDHFMIGFGAVKQPFHYVQFYEQIGVEYNQCWKLFPELKSTQQSKELYKELISDKKDYIIVVDTNSWGTYDLKIESNLPIIKTFITNKGTGIFDWFDIVINAKEIHTVGTAFFHLADHIKKYSKNVKLFFHNCRKDFDTVDKQHNWIKVDYE